MNEMRVMAPLADPRVRLTGEDLKRLGRLLYGVTWRSPLSRALDVGEFKIRSLSQPRMVLPPWFVARLQTLILKRIAHLNFELDVIEGRMPGDDRSD